LEEDMLKVHLMAGLAATALMTAAAVAQTSPAPAGGQSGAGTSNAAAAGQLMAQMPQDMMRGSKLMGIDVYGSDNQKIGDIDEVIIDRQGKIHAVVVGVGGFLGIGQKDVGIPYDQLQWMSNQEVQAQNNQNQGGGSGTNTAGGMTTASGGANQPATTGSTGGAGGTMGAGGAGGATTTASGSGSDNNMPARAMVKMTKADLQNAPEFRYSANEGNRAGAGGTNPPAATNPPGTAPRQ